jgi:hypothetical protein
MACFCFWRLWLFYSLEEFFGSRPSALLNAMKRAARMAVPFSSGVRASGIAPEKGTMASRDTIAGKDGGDCLVCGEATGCWSRRGRGRCRRVRPQWAGIRPWPEPLRSRPRRRRVPPGPRGARRWRGRGCQQGDGVALGVDSMIWIDKGTVDDRDARTSPSGPMPRAFHPTLVV